MVGLGLLGGTVNQLSEPKNKVVQPPTVSTTEAVTTDKVTTTEPTTKEVTTTQVTTQVTTKATTTATTKVATTKPTTKVENTTTTLKQKSTVTFKVTAYCACAKCCGKTDGITASGTRATQGRTIAADPRYYPYGTKIVLNGNTYVVEDCGGAIKGNRIDLYFDSHQDALNWGVRYIEGVVM